MPHMIASIARLSMARFLSSSGETSLAKAEPTAAVSASAMTDFLGMMRLSLRLSRQRGMRERPLKPAHGRRLDVRSQHLVQAVVGHDVGLPAEDACGVVLHVHQLEETEFAFFVVEKQIDGGIVARLATRRRAEQVQVFDAELFEIGFVLLQPAYGFIAFHDPHYSKFRRLVPCRFVLDLGS